MTEDFAFTPSAEPGKRFGTEIDCSGPQRCRHDLTPPYYCRRHAEAAGIPVHPTAHGVIVRGERILDARIDTAMLGIRR